MKIPWFSGYSRPHHSFAEGRIFDFEKSRSMENAFLSVWFAPIHQCKHGWYWVILLQFERTELLSFVVSHNQINLTNRLKNKHQSLMFPRNFKAISTIFTQPQYCEYNFINIRYVKNKDHRQLTSTTE